MTLLGLLGLIGVPASSRLATAEPADAADTVRMPRDGAPEVVAPRAARGERPAVAPLAALALTSAALSAALFLLVILLIEGWGLSPGEAALVVTAMPLAALVAGAGRALATGWARRCPAASCWPAGWPRWDCCRARPPCGRSRRSSRSARASGCRSARSSAHSAAYLDQYVLLPCSISSPPASIARTAAKVSDETRPRAASSRSDSSSCDGNRSVSDLRS